MPVPPIPDDRQDGTTIRAAHVNQIAAGVNDLQQQINDLPPGGYSAYELWLQDGNSGTVEDFLASLRSTEPPDQATVEAAVEATVSDAVAEWNDGGLLSARPDASTLGDGATFFATDDLGGTLSVVIGGVWVRQSTSATNTTVSGHGNYVSGSVQETLERMDDAHGVTARLDHRMQVIEWDAMFHSAPDQTWDSQDFITPGGLGVLVMDDTTIPSAVETRPLNDLRLEVSEHSAAGALFGTGAVRVMSKARHHTSSTVDLRCRMRIPGWGGNNPTEVRFGGVGGAFRVTTASTSNRFDVYALPSDTLIGEIDHYTTHDFRLVGVNGFWQWWLDNELIHSETSTAPVGYSGAYVSLSKTAAATGTEPRDVAITRLYGAWTV